MNIFFPVILSQFVTILIDVDCTPFRRKVNEACPFRVSLYSFLDTRFPLKKFPSVHCVISHMAKKMKNTRLKFPMSSSYDFLKKIFLNKIATSSSSIG